MERFTSDVLALIEDLLDAFDDCLVRRHSLRITDHIVEIYPNLDFTDVQTLLEDIAVENPHFNYELACELSHQCVKWNNNS